MYHKLEVVGFVYTTAAAVGHIVVTAVGSVPTVSPDMLSDSALVPAFAGACAASLFTLSDMFDDENEKPITEIAFKSVITIVAGFIVGYYAAVPVNNYLRDSLSMPIGVPLTALILGVLGERIVAFIRSLNVSKIWSFIYSRLPKGGS